MCDPVSLGIASAAVGAAGSLYSGFTQAAAYKDQARFADRQAVSEGQAGRYEEQRLKSSNDRQLAGMKQQFVSGGIDPNSGSSKEVIADSATQASLDEQAVLYGAKVRADNKRFEAKLARKNATSAIISGVIGAASSVVGGMTQTQDFNNARTRIINPYQQAGSDRYGFGIPV